MKYNYFFAKQLGLDMKDQDKLMQEIISLVNSNIRGNDSQSKQDALIGNIAMTVDKINKKIVNNPQNPVVSGSDNSNELLLQNFKLVKEIYNYIQKNKTDFSNSSSSDITPNLTKIFEKLNELNKPVDNNDVISRLYSIEQKIDAFSFSNESVPTSKNHGNDKLQANYDALQSQFVNLKSEFNSLDENNKLLIRTHNDLVDKYNGLLESNLNKNNDNSTQLAQLQDKFNSSEAEKLNLEQKLYILDQKHRKLIQENTELKYQLEKTQTRTQTPTQTQIPTPIVDNNSLDFHKFEIINNQNVCKLNSENFEEFLNNISDLSVIEQAFTLYNVDNIYFKLLDKYKKHLKKCIENIDLDDYIEDNLSEINNVIDNGLVNSIIKPMASSKNNSVEEKCINSINLYFEQIGYYTSNDISVGDILSSEHASIYEILKCTDNSKKVNEIHSIELLPYCINFINSDNQNVTAKIKGRVVIYKHN